MILMILAAACMIYDSLYLAHCVRSRQYRAAAGIAALMVFAAAGTIFYGFNAL